MDSIEPSSVMGPTVSVIIPTYNRLARLQRVLTALADQTYPAERLEIVVVSDGSTDGTDQYLQDHPPVELVFACQPNAGPAAARNRGIELASGTLVVFVDDDVIPVPGLVEQHVESHRKGGDGLVVIGPMLTPLDVELSPWVQWEQTMLYRQYDAMVKGCYEPTPRQFYTGNASVARDALVEVGGFDTRFFRAEDIELAYRLQDAGLRFVFNPDAIGYHHADRSFASWLQIAHDYGVNDVVFARDQRRDAVGQIVREGFERRAAPIRWITSACVAQPPVDAAARRVFKAAYVASTRIRARRVTRFALSGLYNTSYYRGLADELGGPVAFRQVVASPGAWS